MLQPSARASGQVRQPGGQQGAGQRLPARQARRPGALPLQQPQLVAQKQNLQVLIAAGAPRDSHQIDKEQDEMEQDEPDPGDSLTDGQRASARGCPGWSRSYLIAR